MDPIIDLSLDGLTQIISESSKTISDCIKEQSLPELSFDVGGPDKFPVPPSFQKVQLARLKLIEATRLLEVLALGPGDAMRAMAARVSSSKFSRATFHD